MRPISRKVVSQDRLLAVVDQGAVSAANMLTAIVVGRACSVDELGLYAAGTSVFVLAFSAQKALILTPYIVLNPRLHDEEHRRYKGSSLVHLLALSAFMATALGVSGFVVGDVLGNRALGSLLLTLAVVGVLVLFREYARQLSYAELRVRNALVMDTCVAVLQALGVLVLGFAGVLNAEWAFVVTGAACGAASLGWLAAHSRSISARLPDAKRDFSRNWYFGKWLFASGLLQVASVGLYPWIIISLRGASEAGIWAAAVGVVALSNPVMLALFNEAAPRISHDFATGGAAVLRQSASRTASICGLATVPFLLAFLVFGQELVTLIYGVKYAAAISALRWLALNAMVDACAFALPHGLFNLGRPKWDFLGNAVSLSVLILLGLWFTWVYGSVGAALGVLAANSAGVAVKAAGFRLELRRASP